MDKWDPERAAWLSRGRRHAVELEATVVTDDGEVSSHVTDLSLEGCCLTGDFRIGERLTVRIAKLGEFKAQIRWALSGRAGARLVPTAAEREKLLAEDDKGAAAIEYALMAALIALAIVAALTRTGDAVSENWNEVNSAMPHGVEFEAP